MNSGDRSIFHPTQRIKMTSAETGAGGSSDRNGVWATGYLGTAGFPLQNYLPRQLYAGGRTPASTGTAAVWPRIVVVKESTLIWRNVAHLTYLLYPVAVTDGPRDHCVTSPYHVTASRRSLRLSVNSRRTVVMNDWKQFKHLAAMLSILRYLLTLIVDAFLCWRRPRKANKLLVHLTWRHSCQNLWETPVCIVYFLLPTAVCLNDTENENW